MYSLILNSESNIKNQTVHETLRFIFLSFMLLIV